MKISFFTIQLYFKQISTVNLHITLYNHQCEFCAQLHQTIRVKKTVWEEFIHLILSIEPPSFEDYGPLEIINVSVLSIGLPTGCWPSRRLWGWRETDSVCSHDSDLIKPSGPHPEDKSAVADPETEIWWSGGEWGRLPVTLTGGVCFRTGSSWPTDPDLHFRTRSRTQDRMCDHQGQLKERE